jgi:hypothetical protein
MTDFCYKLQALEKESLGAAKVFDFIQKKL